MVEIYSTEGLDTYLKNDFILKELEEYKSDAEFVSHKWLLDIPAKRMIYADVYGEFLKNSGKKVLDVGGGFCGLTRTLLENNDYTLLDIMAHDDHAKMKVISSAHDNFWHNTDWYEFEPKETYDVVIANDLFPNVDQRLRLFVEKFKDHCKEMIVTLTCNDKDIFYTVKRVDADEILTMAPWTRFMTEKALQTILQDNSVTLPESTDAEPLFRNGRVVYMLRHTFA